MVSVIYASEEGKIDDAEAWDPRQPWAGSSVRSAGACPVEFRRGVIAPWISRSVLDAAARSNTRSVRSSGTDLRAGPRVSTFDRQRKTRGVCPDLGTFAHLDHAGAVIAHEGGNFAFVSHGVCLLGGSGRRGASASGAARATLRCGDARCQGASRFERRKTDQARGPETRRCGACVAQTVARTARDAPFVRSSRVSGSRGTCVARW